MVNNWATIPSLQGLRKDHKGDLEGNPTLGPKLRPLAAANKAPNANLGNMIAKIIKAIGDDLSDRKGGEVISTEHLKNMIEVNQHQHCQEME